MLKHYENQGRPAADLPLVEYACRSLLYQAQEQLHSFLRNFPVRWLAGLMRLVIFPRGLTYSAPSDRLNPQIAELMMNPGEARERLCHYVYRTLEPGNHLGLVQQAMELAIAAEPILKRIRVEGVKTGKVKALDLPGPDPRGAGGARHHRGGGRAAARVRPQGHGHHRRRRLRAARTRRGLDLRDPARRRPDPGRVRKGTQPFTRVARRRAGSLAQKRRMGKRGDAFPLKFARSPSGVSREGSTPSPAVPRCARYFAANRVEPLWQKNA